MDIKIILAVYVSRLQSISVHAADIVNFLIKDPLCTACQKGFNIYCYVHTNATCI